MRCHDLLIAKQSSHEYFLSILDSTQKHVDNFLRMCISERILWEYFLSKPAQHGILWEYFLSKPAQNTLSIFFVKRNKNGFCRFDLTAQVLIVAEPFAVNKRSAVCPARLPRVK